MTGERAAGTRVHSAQAHAPSHGDWHCEVSQLQAAKLQRPCLLHGCAPRRFFWLNAGILALGLLLYILLARRYTEKPLAKRSGAARRNGGADEKAA